MAKAVNIPTRPSDMSRFKKMDKRICDVITAHVALSMPKHRAFALYYPEYLSTKVSAQGNTSLTAMGEDICRQVFSNPTHQEYLDAYTDTLTSFLNGRGVQTVKPTDDDTATNEKRKEVALASLLDKAMSLVETESSIDPDTLKTCTEIFKRLNILKEAQEEEEKPRRYLPTRCYSECTYRLFVETQKEKGDIIDECDFCRTRKFAESCGWKFDAARNLDLPTGLTSYQK